MIRPPYTIATSPNIVGLVTVLLNTPVIGLLHIILEKPIPQPFRPHFQNLQQSVLRLSFLETSHIFDHAVRSFFQFFFPFILRTKKFVVVMLRFLREGCKIGCHHVLTNNPSACGMRAAARGFSGMVNINFHFVRGTSVSGNLCLKTTLSNFFKTCDAPIFKVFISTPTGLHTGCCQNAHKSSPQDYRLLFAISFSLSKIPVRERKDSEK